MTHGPIALMRLRCPLLWSSNLSASWQIPEDSQPPRVQVMMAVGLFCPEEQKRNSKESGQVQGGWNLLWDGCSVHTTQCITASVVVQAAKNLPVMWEIWVQSLGWEDPLEKGMATDSSILAWRIPMDRGAWQAIVHGVSKSQTHWATNHSPAQDYS